jgi:hypothetical protein
MTGSLINIPMHDGSRMFAAIRATLSPGELARQLARIPGIVITDVIFTASDDWIRFDLGEWRFDVNGQFGEFWFFALDAATPDHVLHAIVQHAESVLQSGAAQEVTEQRLTAMVAGACGLLAFGIANLSLSGRQSPLLLVLSFAAGVVLGHLAAAHYRLRGRQDLHDQNFLNATG